MSNPIDKVAKNIAGNSEKYKRIIAQTGTDV